MEELGGGRRGEEGDWRQEGRFDLITSPKSISPLAGKFVVKGTPTNSRCRQQIQMKRQTHHRRAVSACMLVALISCRRPRPVGKDSTSARVQRFWLIMIAFSLRDGGLGRARRAARTSTMSATAVRGEREARAFLARLSEGERTSTTSATALRGGRAARYNTWGSAARYVEGVRSETCGERNAVREGAPPVSY